MGLLYKYNFTNDFVFKQKRTRDVPEISRVSDPNKYNDHQTTEKQIVLLKVLKVMECHLVLSTVYMTKKPKIEPT